MTRIAFRHGSIRLLFLVLVTIGLFGSSSLPERSAHAWPKPHSEHFVLVHGAWHGAWCWYNVQTMLESQGNEVTVLDLPGHGVDQTPPASVQLSDYTQKVVDYLDNIDGPVVLVGHSMGGVVISEVAEARPEKVEKLVYLAAFMLEDGVSLLDMATTDTDSIAGQNLIVDFPNGVIDIDRSVVEDAFYGESPRREVTLAKTVLRANPIFPIITPIHITPENYGSVPRYYIQTTDDHAVTPWAQEMMYTATPVERVYTIHSDHSAFFSAPAHLVAILNAIARR